jgi:hypothetical protein
VSPVKYELGSYIPEDGILQSHRWKQTALEACFRSCSLQSRESHSYHQRDVVLAGGRLYGKHKSRSLRSDVRLDSACDATAHRDL